MSRIGKQPVVLPKGVTLEISDGQVHAKGPKGTLSRAVVRGTTISVDGGKAIVERASDSLEDRAAHGLMRALLANMVEGVSKGFQRKLEIIGIGYKAELKGSTLVLSLGYSHPIEFPFPPGITIAVEKNTKMVVSGIDREQVGQVAAELRSFRSPDSYKGKGVRYEGEHVRIKAGKSGQ